MKIYSLTALEAGGSGGSDQDTSRSGLWYRLSFWLLDGHILTLHSPGLSSCVCTRASGVGSKLTCVFYYKDPNPIKPEPTLTTSSNPNYLPKVPSQNAITSEVEVSTYEFGGNRCSVHRKGRHAVLCHHRF